MESSVDFWLIRVKRTFHPPFSLAERSSDGGESPAQASLGWGFSTIGRK
ncbi:MULTISPECIES: hypothetical protein [unclassified Rossellomorea]|nr:hypothetical protein [uncultured Rossellomorea sp.]